MLCLVTVGWHLFDFSNQLTSKVGSRRAWADIRLERGDFDPFSEVG